MWMLIIVSFAMDGGTAIHSLGMASEQECKKEALALNNAPPVMANTARFVGTIRGYCVRAA